MAISSLFKLFDAEKTTRVGEIFDVSMRGNKSIQFVRSDHSSGSATLEIQVSNDGTNFVTYNRLITNVTHTNSQSDTMVSSATLSANGSTMLFLEHGEQIRYIRGSLNVVTDGTHDVYLSCSES